MKLYFSPGACSLSPHIVLHEAGYDFSAEKVDLKAHRTASGAALADVHAKNYVPILELDNGERLTEGAAIVQFLADQKPESGLLPQQGAFERYRAQEWLNYIASELHKSFQPLFQRDSASQDWQQWAERKLGERFGWLSAQLADRSYVLGERFSVVDAYLFTVLNWTNFVALDLKPWPVLQRYLERIAARPAVQRAMSAEGLAVKAAAA